VNGASDKLSSKPLNTVTVLSLVLLGSVAACVFLIFSEYDAVAPDGSDVLLTLTPFLVGLPMLGCAVAIPVSIVYGVSRRHRRQALLVIVCCALFIGSVIISVRIGWAIRRSAFEELAERSATLVNAVKAHSEQYGKPPESLQALIPEFLSEVPRTGIAAYPKYSYFVGKQDTFDGNPWVLKVGASTGILDFDEFMYYPLQNYPASRCGNRLEPIRDWAYMHE
jgi:hypothetical protein